MGSRRGGRGIEGSAVSTTAATPTTVPVGSIAHSPRNPRDTYNDIADLAASVEQVGLLQPLGVVRYEVYLARYPQYESEVGSAHWVVIHGNRRLAAARQAELAEVPVVVQDRVGREGTFDESTLIENVHRADLPPLREAALLQELVDKHGSQRQAAKAVGKTSGWVTQRMSLLKLVPELQAKLSSGQITIAAARDLAPIPATRQLDAYERGEPYRDPAKPTPEPAAQADSSDRTTYTRTEVPQESAYGVSTQDPVETGRSNGHCPKDKSEEPSAYAVSTPAAPEEADENGAGAYGVSTQAPSSALNLSGGSSRTLPSAPVDLVTAIEHEYTAEQRQEVLHLLQR